MKIAIMQPYFFPYIGYFQLINAVDKFIFYDDVNFIKNGWVNRNRILINKEPHYITVQLRNASSFKKINSIEFTNNREKLKKTINQSYKKAPYFYKTWEVIEEVLDYNTCNISELAIFSILNVTKYLGLNKIFEISSKHYAETQSLGKIERLVKICKINNAKEYINSIGGLELYKKNDFRNNGVDLKFIKTNEIKYQQFDNEFIPLLSIIDMIMFNHTEKIKEMLNMYEII